MSILSEGYSSYMTHFHKFQKRITTFNSAFNHVFELAREGIFIDCDIEDKLDNYPKYPCIYRYTGKVSIYNLLKIHHAALDTVDVLVDYITSKNALEIKPNLDNIPTDLEKIKNDIYLQYTFFSDIDDIFTLRQHFHDYSFLKNKISYSNALSDPVYNELHKGHSFIHLFLFDFIFRQQLKNNANFSSPLNISCIDDNVFLRQDIIDEFKQFVDDNEQEFLNNVINIIIQSLYKMSNTDEDLVNYIRDNIDSNIDILKTAFETFVNTSTSLPSAELSYYCLNAMYLAFGTKTIDTIFNDATIFDEGYIASIKSSEDEVFNDFMDSVSSTNLKSYLYLSYLYKFWPVKFLNIYPIIIDKYITDVVKPETTYAYSQRYLETILKKFISEPNINYDNLTSYFQSNVDNAYLHTLCQDEGIVQFGSFIYFIKLIDNFMESDLYNDFTDGLYYDVFIALREKGYIDPNFNWCKCKELFNLFFKSFIRSSISSGNIFSNVTTQYETAFLNVINNNTGNPDYDVDIEFSSSKLSSLYNSMIISHFDKIHGFVESMYISKLSDIVNYKLLSYFLVDQS